MVLLYNHMKGRGLDIPFTLEDLRVANAEQLKQYGGLLDNFSRLENVSDLTIEVGGFLRSVKKSEVYAEPVVPEHLKEVVSKIPTNVDLLKRSSIHERE